MRTDYFNGKLSIEGNPTVGEDADLIFSFETSLLKRNETWPANFSRVEINLFATNVMLKRNNWIFDDMGGMTDGIEAVETTMRVQSEGEWKIGAYANAITSEGGHDTRVYYIYGYSVGNQTRFSSSPSAGHLKQPGVEYDMEKEQ